MEIVTNEDYHFIKQDWKCCVFASKKKKAINICFFYVIACVLDTHLRVGFLGSFILIKLLSWYSQLAFLL